WMRRVNIIEDPRDPNPARRFKMIYADIIGGRLESAKAFSPDGLHWELNVDGQPLYPRYNEDLMGWDARSQEYVLFGDGRKDRELEMEQRGLSPEEIRAELRKVPIRDKEFVGRRTSKDFLTWSKFQPVLKPGVGDDE